MNNLYDIFDKKLKDNPNPDKIDTSNELDINDIELGEIYPGKMIELIENEINALTSSIKYINEAIILAKKIDTSNEQIVKTACQRLGEARKLLERLDY